MYFKQETAIRQTFLFCILAKLISKNDVFWIVVEQILLKHFSESNRLQLKMSNKGRFEVC